MASKDRRIERLQSGQVGGVVLDCEVRRGAMSRYNVHQPERLIYLLASDLEAINLTRTLYPFNIHASNGFLRLVRTAKLRFTAITL